MFLNNIWKYYCTCVNIHVSWFFCPLHSRGP